jgi:hypothetical protein
VQQHLHRDRELRQRGRRIGLVHLAKRQLLRARQLLGVLRRRALLLPESSLILSSLTAILVLLRRGALTPRQGRDCGTMPAAFEEVCR